MNKETKQKIMLIALAALLIGALAYIAVEKARAYYQTGIEKAQQQGYIAGVTDALATAYTQTSNCQVTTIYLGNATREIADYECLKKAAEAQKGK